MLQQYKYASQVRRLEIEKGTRWVAEYWSINAKKQLNNTIFNGGNPYGNKGDNYWEQTALSEGWGYFMEWTMARDILGWNSLTDSLWKDSPRPPHKNLSFPYQYATMFYDLCNIGCTYQNMEKCLRGYSLAEYKQNIINIYPAKYEQISQIIKNYE